MKKSLACGTLTATVLLAGMGFALPSVAKASEIDVPVRHQDETIQTKYGVPIVTDKNKDDMTMLVAGVAAGGAMVIAGAGLLVKYVGKKGSETGSSEAVAEESDEALTNTGTEDTEPIL